MNSIPLTETESGARNAQPPAWGGCISIVFISQPPIEIPVNQSAMQPAPYDQSPASGDRSDATFLFGPGGAGLAATLKSPRFPETSASLAHPSSPAPTPRFFKTAQHERDLFDATLRALTHRPARDNVRPELKLVEFSLAAPGAKKVQLAADFTDWERAPLDLVSFADGYWSTIVPLPAGTYAYRFLVDGQWHDHPYGETPDPQFPDSLKAYVQIK